MNLDSIEDKLLKVHKLAPDLYDDIIDTYIEIRKDLTNGVDIDERLEDLKNYYKLVDSFLQGFLQENNRSMNFLAKHIVEQIEGKTTAVYAGGFKPPTRGHFEVVQQALKQNPEIDEFIIFVGEKPRNGITQSQSVLIWEIYKRYLPFKVTIIPTKVAPIRAVYDYAKEHPQDEVLWVIGAREGNEEDFKDLASRTKSMDKYPNLELRTIVTSNGVSGTAARNALKVDDNKFLSFLPNDLEEKEKQEVLDIVVKAPIEDEAEDLNEQVNTDFKKHIASLTKKMVEDGLTVQPLPKVIFKKDEAEAEDFFGKTAYYEPSSQTIVLYVKDRHPKDIVRSFAHEMIHHIQNLEGRLGDISTTNTNEDDALLDLEKEAYLDGNITFRNWTDSLTGNKLEELKQNPISKTPKGKLFLVELEKFLNL